MYIYRDGSVRKLKDGLTKDVIQSYFERHPDAVECDAPPTMDQLGYWVSDCVAESIDGCMVEPDGHCEHNMPSWLLALGMI